MSVIKVYQIPIVILFEMFPHKIKFRGSRINIFACTSVCVCLTVCVSVIVCICVCGGVHVNTHIYVDAREKGQVSSSINSSILPFETVSHIELGAHQFCLASGKKASRAYLHRQSLQLHMLPSLSSSPPHTHITSTFTK